MGASAGILVLNSLHICREMVASCFRVCRARCQVLMIHAGLLRPGRYAPSGRVGLAPSLPGEKEKKYMHVDVQSRQQPRWR